MTKPQVQTLWCELEAVAGVQCKSIPGWTRFPIIRQVESGARTSMTQSMLPATTPRPSRRQVANSPRLSWRPGVPAGAPPREDRSA